MYYIANKYSALFVTYLLFAHSVDFSYIRLLDYRLYQEGTYASTSYTVSSMKIE